MMDLEMENGQSFYGPASKPKTEIKKQVCLQHCNSSRSNIMTYERYNHQWYSHIGLMF